MLFLLSCFTVILSFLLPVTCTKLLLSLTTVNVVLAKPSVHTISNVCFPAASVLR